MMRGKRSTPSGVNIDINGSMKYLKRYLTNNNNQQKTEISQ